MERARVRIVSGKGGVGKTTVACALARSRASRGVRVLLAGVQGGDQAASILGVDPVGAQMREVLENLHLVDMNPTDAIHEYVLLTFKFEAIYNAVFENRFVKHFLRLVPSLAELVMLGKLWYHHQEQVDGRPRFDEIIVDAPATGHAIAMLRAPSVVKRTVPPGPMRDNAEDIETMFLERSVFHLVTTPEEMPVNEVRDLERAAVELLNLEIGTAFVNQRLAPLDISALEELEKSGKHDELCARLRTREAKRLAGERHLARLPAGLLEGSISLPRIVTQGFGPEQLRTLVDVLDEGWEGAQ